MEVQISLTRRGGKGETVVETDVHPTAMEEFHHRLSGLEQNVTGMGAEMGSLSEQLAGVMANHNTTHESILEPVNPTPDLTCGHSTSALHTETASLLSDLTFSGARNENIRTFLQKLDACAELFSLSDTQKSADLW